MEKHKIGDYVQAWTQDGKVVFAEKGSDGVGYTLCYPYRLTDKGIGFVSCLGIGIDEFRTLWEKGILCLRSI